MSVVGVNYSSIGRALRSGMWVRLGRFDLAKPLVQPRSLVQWPVGTLDVTVWLGSKTYDTRVDDPAIQDLEVIAAWDAEYHMPERLTADFGAEVAEWHIGGPIWRERKTKEERAKRFDEPWHQLPADWVPVIQ